MQPHSGKYPPLKQPAMPACPSETPTTSASQTAYAFFIFPTHILCFLRTVLVSATPLYPHE